MSAVAPEVFGTLPDGSPVHVHTIGGADRPLVRVLDFGATVVSLEAFAPDAGGRRADVVLGHPGLAGYTASPTAYLGAIVGRYANRIASSTFTLNGRTHTLAANEGRTCLHGGPEGFHSRLWRVAEASTDAIRLELTSADGDQGFPGELTTTVTYRVSTSSVHVDITARTTAPTVVNVTNHSYWNLAGEGAGSVDSHLLTVDADEYLPIDDHSIPLGGPEPVEGTALDLRRAREIGATVRADDPQTAITRGLDHCLLIRGEGMRRAARLEHPGTGRALEVHSDQPGLQVYTGNYLDGSIVGSSGRRYRQGDGVALETQRLPDAPNRSWRPSPVLDPDDTYHSSTEWRFSG
ncbi:MAG TPA: aldose epimerase family protein [Ornithinibacter sp.]|nr:aldose epimerase family protein [Ornithinibacter sp.]